MNYVIAESIAHSITEFHILFLLCQYNHFIFFLNMCKQFCVAFDFTFAENRETLRKCRV